MDSKRSTAEAICRRLREAGFRALLAGGCVRDTLRGVEPGDYDIATSATPEQIAAMFDRTVGVGAAFGVQVVILDEGYFEVATFRRDGPYVDGRHPSHVEFTDEKGDAARRDFTVNAMFYDPATGAVLDYVDGRADLEAKRIRTVGDPYERFAEDHLRLMRAVRFAVQLDFTIDDDTMAAMRALAPKIVGTSPERIRDELLKMLTRGSPRRAIELMDASRLLEHVLPEVARMKGVDQPPEYHPEGDVYVHTLLVLDQLKNPSPELALGALLHDVGKPPTQTFEDRIRFNGHEVVGAEISEAICRRLRMSNEQTERVKWLVGQHMRVGHAPEMRVAKVKRLIREDGFPELLELLRADCLGSHGDLSAYDWLQDYCVHVPDEERRPERLITGQDLIEMGYEPGPLFSEILETVEDAQLEGALDSAENAREFVRSQWPLRAD